MKDIKIQIAELRDIDQCVLQTKIGLSQSPIYNQYKFDSQLVRENVKQFITQQNKIIFVLKLNNIIVGGLAAGYYPMFFSIETESLVHFIWIHPNYRTLKLFNKLITCYTNWAEYNKVNKVLLGYSFGDQVDRFDRLYKYKKFKRIGSIYQQC